jgi:hypothetical protein
MNKPAYLTKSITIRGVDGNDIRVSETAERDTIVISIQQNDDAGRIATVRLDQGQDDAFCRTRYDMEFVEPVAEPAMPVPLDPRIDLVGQQEVA